MFSKSIFAVSAAVFLTSTAGAFAQSIRTAEVPVPENLDVRYLKSVAIANAASAPVAYEVPEGLTGRYLPATVAHVKVRPAMRVVYDVPENRIGDKYPQLERTAAMMKHGRHKA